MDAPQPLGPPLAAARRDRRSPPPLLSEEQIARMPSHRAGWTAIIDEFPRLLEDVRRNAVARVEAELRGTGAYHPDAASPFANVANSGGPVTSVRGRTVFRREAPLPPLSPNRDESAQVLEPEELRRILGQSSGGLPSATHYTLVRTHEAPQTTTTTKTTVASLPAVTDSSAADGAKPVTTNSDVTRQAIGRNRFVPLSAGSSGSSLRPEARQPTKLRVFRREAFDGNMLDEMTRAANEFEFGDELLKHNRQQDHDSSSSDNSKQLAAHVAQVEELLAGLQQLSAPAKPRFRREAFEPSMLQEMAKASDEFEYADQLPKVPEKKATSGSKSTKEDNRSRPAQDHRSMFESHVKQMEEMMEKMRSFGDHSGAGGHTTGTGTFTGHSGSGGRSAASGHSTASGHSAASSHSPLRQHPATAHNSVTSNKQSSFFSGQPSSGQYSPSRGPYSQSSGPYSQSSGQYLASSGQYSPSSGQYSTSSGQSSTSSGPYSPSSGQYSPSSGQFSPSSGQYSSPGGKILFEGPSTFSGQYSTSGQPSSSGQISSQQLFSPGDSQSTVKKLQRRAAADVEGLQELKKTLDNVDFVSEIMKATTSPADAIEKMKATEQAVDETIHQLLGGVHQSDIDDLIQLTKAASSVESEIHEQEAVAAAKRIRRATGEQRLEAAVAGSVTQVAKANHLISKDLGKAFEAMLEAEAELDRGLRQLVGQQRLENIGQARRQRRSSGDEEGTDTRGDEFAWLLRQLELTEAEAKSLHLATVEDIRRYARGRLREQQKKQEASGGGVTFPKTISAVEEKDGLSMEDIMDALRGLRQAIPTEVEAAAMGAVEVGKHLGSRLQPLVTDSYRAMAYKVLPQARQSVVDSLSPEMKDIARQGRALVTSGARVASDYANPRMARLRENLGLLRSQIQQV